MISVNERFNSDRSKYVLFPDSNFRTFWDLISFLLILYQSLIVPFKLTFEPDLPIEFVQFDLFQDSFFIIDVFLNFNTGYYSKGTLVLQRDEIFRDYLKSW